MTLKLYTRKGRKILWLALSRKDEKNEALLCALSILQEIWVVEAKEEWKNDVAQ